MHSLLSQGLTMRSSKLMNMRLVIEVCPQCVTLITDMEKVDKINHMTALHIESD